MSSQIAQALHLARIDGRLDIIEPQLRRLIAQYENLIEDLKSKRKEINVEPKYVEVTDEGERVAVHQGKLEGEIYKDGEIYVLLDDLRDWRSSENARRLEQRSEP